MGEWENSGARISAVHEIKSQVTEGCQSYEP